MNSKHSPSALAARREALLAQCALQRVNAASDIREIMAPVNRLRRHAGRNLLIPLSLAGAALGIVAQRRRGKLVPMLTTALSIWKLGRKATALLRQKS